jgi:membrane protein implicated in regulation of membrane protease activity
MLPLHPLGIAVYLTIAIFFVVLFTIGFVRSAKRMAIIGYGGGALIFLGGSAFSIMIHMLHVGMSGDPADSPLWIGLLISTFAACPFFLFAWARIRQLKHKPGHCKQCQYDLRGNRGAKTCPECGAKVSKRGQRR